MALSASGKYLYIGVDGANAVRVYDMTKQAMGPLISLGAGLPLADLSAVPGYPDSIAGERQNRSYSPSESGTMIFDADGTSRKNVINGGHSLVFEPLTNRMYGFENEISSNGIRTMTADTDGTVELGYIEGVLVGNAHLIAGRNGLLFSDTGGALSSDLGVPEIKAGGTYKVVLKARLHKGDDAIGLFVLAIVNATSTVAEANRKNNIVPSAAIP